MDDRQNDEPRARASLRGKGREILLGQHSDGGAPPQETASSSGPVNPAPAHDAADSSALALTTDEMDALLDFSDDSPVYRPGYSFSRSEGVSAWGVEQQQPTNTPGADSADFVDSVQSPDTTWEIGDYSEETMESQTPERYSAEPVQETNAQASAVIDDDEELTGQGVNPRGEWQDVSPDDFPVDGRDLQEPEVYAAAPAESEQDGLPIAERPGDPEAGFPHMPYDPDDEVQALIPAEPEQWSDALLNEPDREVIEPVLRRPVSDGPVSHDEAASDFDPAAPHDDGGVMLPSAEATEERELPGTIGDPFPVPPRTGSEELFRTTPPPDKGMLDQLVDDKRIQKLWKQIETLHEELVAEVEGDRSTTDEYQRELLRASGLLLESRQNYDDTRAIVYRIRADLNRRRKVTADIRRYRPMLMAYYVAWGVALAVLFLLKHPLLDLTDSFGSTVIAALYYPLLLGIAGALISGYLTLDRHTTKQRDFDPIHITWYLFNPLLGGVMGLLMFLLASIANEDLLQEAASRGEMAITYLLCVIAGMNQSNVLRRLNELMDRFGTSSKK